MAEARATQVRIAEERAAEARRAAERVASAPAAPAWGAKQAKRLEIERLRREIEERKKP